jgi:multimeric flavodoxin WrbA
MKIVVLNGSPKGITSVTMQYVHYIQKRFPSHEFKITNIAQEIKKIESDREYFQSIINDIRTADGVLWAFPLYFLLVASQYKRFIELIWENNAQEVFRDKYAAALSTSIKFHDHSAHNYIRAVSEDLQMRNVGFFSAHMYDLVHRKEQQRLTLFAGDFIKAIEQRRITTRVFPPMQSVATTYMPGPVTKKVDNSGLKTLIVSDCENDTSNLARMIARLKAAFLKEVEVINLRELNIKGGCLGCINCGIDNTCVYAGKDDYIEFYNTKFKTADILILAGAIKDRYLSAKTKEFFDRSFFNNHSPTLQGKQVGGLVSGPLGQIPNLRQIIEASFEFQQTNLVDIVTDEEPEATQLDSLLDSLAQRLVDNARAGYIKPVTFLSFGGKKIFRDDIYGSLRFVFQADHRYYKKHGFYDFPQKNYKIRLINGVMMLLTKIPGFRKEFKRRIKPEMIKPFQRVLRSS